MDPLQGGAGGDALAGAGALGKASAQAEEADSDDSKVTFQQRTIKPPSTTSRASWKPN
jgi:hypothetical protein